MHIIQQGGVEFVSIFRRKIYIYAYLAGNLGDDMMVRILCGRYPHVLFETIADSSYRNRFKDIENLMVYSPGDRKAVREEAFFRKFFGKEDGFHKFLVKSADASVHIGGSVFVQHFDDWTALIEADRTLRRLSKRLYVIGANFGPYTDDAYYQAYHTLLGTYDGVSLRDESSYRLFRDLPDAVCAPDVFFNFHSDEIRTENKKQAVFSVISLTDRTGKYDISRYREDYLAFCAAMANQCIQQGYGVLFVSFCRAQGDEEAAEEIICRLPEAFRPSARLLRYDRNWKECIQAFAESSLVIGTRFHSIVFGWFYGKRVLPVVYDPKTEHMLDDNHIDFRVSFRELPAQDPAVLFQKLTELAPFDSSKLKAEAPGQFRKLDVFLKQAGRGGNQG